MLGGIPIIRVIGMAGGALILVIGVFVLRAKSESNLHRLFFALAVADGVSTFAFNLALAPVSEPVRLHAFLVYYYGFLAFLALLVAFGAIFPRPILANASLPRTGIALAAILGVVMLAHGISYEWFWTPTRSAATGLGFSLTRGGRVVATIFSLATAFIILRAAFLLRRESSPSHRLQGALVLGGMAIGYAPFPTTLAIVGFSRGVQKTYFSSEWSIAIFYAASLLTLLCVIATMAIVFLESRADRSRERKIALACLGVVLVLTLFSVRDPTFAAADRIQTSAVLIYPILLGYAIARYEVLDIDAHVRRAATASLLGAGFTAAFLLFEVFLEQLLQNVLSSGITTVIAGIVAALATALVSVPLARVARKAAQKIAPTLAPDDIAARKREIYRHALHGAAMDGVIAPSELRVLQRLRESLQISDSEHSAIVREVGVAL